MIFNMIAQAAQAAGLEYEEGTYTLSADTNSSIQVPYANSHSKRATITLFCRDFGGEYDGVTYTVYYSLHFESVDFIGNPYYGDVDGGAPSWGLVYYKHRAGSTSTITQTTANITTNTTGSNDHLDTGIPSTSRYWRAGTYKWIAIWI